MAGLVRKLQRAHSLKWNCSSSSSVVGRTLRNDVSGALLGYGSRGYATTDEMIKSPFESNILRILRSGMLVYEKNPPLKPETEFNSFTVKERPGEAVFTIKGKYGDMEDITIDATLFDGYERVPVEGSSAMGTRLHLSLIVDISKRDSGNELVFICSAWPDCLDIHNVFISRHHQMPLRHGQMPLSDRQMPLRPYLGPNFRKLNPKVQEKLHEYLDARGVNNELCSFLHYYVVNKSKTEIMRWMDRLKSFVEK